MNQVAGWLVTLVSIYAAIGSLFAVGFVAPGARRIDAGARNASWGLKLLLLPGAAAFWPLLVRRWITGQAPPVERTAHRTAAKAD